MVRRNPTTPLPATFAGSEPALLTRAEFLALRNPQEKFHDSRAYQSTVADLNQVGGYQIGRAQTRRKKISVYGTTKSETDNLVFRDSETDAVIGILHSGILYQDRFVEIPEWYSALRRTDTAVSLDFKKKEVKYPEEYMHLVDDVVAKNRSKFPHLLQRIALSGEKLEVRAEVLPRLNKLDAIAFINRDGMIVARGDNEWGATLLRVAQEYRGKGLGRALAAIWYEHNPDSKSGGFTTSGFANAVAAWEDRVRLFLERGWYSALIRRGDLTKDRVRAITADLTKRREQSRLPTFTPEITPDLRVYIDDDAISFVLYDARFLTDENEKYILGYGFLRDTDRHGNFFYRIEHVSAYRALATAIGLQLARDQGEALYVADLPADLIEWETIPHVIYEDGHVSLSKDILDLKKISAAERRGRHKDDPYRQKRDMLLELAESKWA